MDQTPPDDPATVRRVVGLAQDLVQDLKPYAIPDSTAEATSARIRLTTATAIF